MERTLAAQTTDLVGKKVRLAGWVDKRRDHGGLVFIDIRDRSGIVQIVGGKELAELRLEDVIEVIGTVANRPENLVNPKLPTGKVEVKAETLKLLSKAGTLPIDMGQENLSVELPTLLDWRPLTLRHNRVEAIFKVQETIIDSFRKTVKDLGFTEFQAPTIVPVATEGGAEIFPVQYYDYTAYLGQSPQLYKQIMVGVFERVFTVGRAYRAEPSTTTRHLSEYITLDLEFGFIDNWEEILDVAEHVIKSMFKSVGDQNKRELAIYKASIPKISEKIPRIKLREAQEIIKKRTDRDILSEPDLSPDDEREICKWAQERGSELVIVTHYPISKRPFYTYPDPANPEYSYSFDLLGRGVEWFTGGQRINDYDQLLASIKSRGLNSDDFSFYLQAFKFGMPPEGGFAIGAERVTAHILGLANIREASLFPRDMERVDVKLSEFRDKNKK